MSIVSLPLSRYGPKRQTLISAAEEKGFESAQTLWGARLLQWTLMAVALSVLWPRYGEIKIPGVPSFLFTTPYNFMATCSWPIFILALFNSADIREKTFKAAKRIWPFFFTLPVFFACRLYSDRSADIPADATRATLVELFWFGALLPLALASTYHAESRRNILRVLLIAALVCGFLGIIEHLSSKPIAILFHLNFNLSTGYSSLVNATIARGGGYRAKSIFVHPIVFGQYMALIAPIALHELMSRGPGHHQRIMKIIALFTLLIIPINIMQSGSRSALLSLVLGLSVYLVLILTSRFSGGVRIIFLVLIGSTLAIAGLGLGQDALSLAQGRNQEERMSTTAREKQFSMAMLAASRQPLFGYGEGMSPEVAGQTGWTVKGTRTIDSYYLSTLVDFGTVGFLLYVLMWGGVELMAIGLALRSGDSGCASVIAAVYASLLASMSIISINNHVQLGFLFLGVLANINRGKSLAAPRKPDTNFQGLVPVGRFSRGVATFSLSRARSAGLRQRQSD